jgi:hypothetical protein
MNRYALTTCICIAGLPGLAPAQSNVDPNNKHAWNENTGWTNWLDADAGLMGVHVGGDILSGMAWSENVGWIHLGDGDPDSPPHYGNADGSDFGVNVDGHGYLFGMAWAENVGWINFEGGALATPPQPAYVDCGGRLDGYAWGENIGWINLSMLEPGKYVAMEAAAAPVSCDINEDGLVDGEDIQPFLDLVLVAGSEANWRVTCAGDVEDVPDGLVDVGDIAAFVDCLLSP